MNTIKLALKITVSAVLLYYCLKQIKIEEVLRIIEGLNISYMLIAFVFTLLGTIVFKAITLWRLLRGRYPTSLVQLIGINLQLRFYTIVLPKALVAAIRWERYRKLSDPKYSTVLFSFEAILSLFVAASCALFFIAIDGNNYVQSMYLFVAFFLVLAFGMLIFVFFMYPNGKLFRGIENILTSIVPFTITQKLFNAWRTTATLMGMSDKTTLWVVGVSTLVGYLLFLIGGYYLLKSLWISIDFATVAWIRSIVFLLVSIPITYAGFGLREAGFVTLFGLYGVTPDTSIAYALMVLIIQVFIGLIGLVLEAYRWIVES